MKISRFTLSVITMLIVVAAVTALSVLRDSPGAARYFPELDSSTQESSSESQETTETDIANPSVMETQAALAQLPPSIRERQESSAGGNSASAGSSSGSGGNDTPSSPSAPKPTAPPPTGLSLEQRKAFYWELIEAQDRAVAEAEAAHPMDSDPPQVDQYVKLWLELTEKYEGEVRGKYGVTKDQANVIVEEGIVNGWPMPPLPE